MKRADDRRHLEVAATTDAADARWLPEGHDPALEQTPREALRYVVVDDLYDDGVLLIGYLWPSVTEAGTLSFGDDPRLSEGGWVDTAPGLPLVLGEPTGAAGGVQPFEDATSRSGWMPRSAVQETVDTARTGTNTPGAATPSGAGASPELTRPLRIGDTFAVVIERPADIEIVTGDDAPPTELIPADAVRLIDITRQARTVAKAAQAAAVSPPKGAQQLDDEIAGWAEQAGAWDLEADVEVIVEDTGAGGEEADPRDAQPTV